MSACSKAGTVKRVVLTSSAAVITVNQLHGKCLVMDEENWSDAEFLTSKKPLTWHWPRHLTSLITGNELLIIQLKGIQMLSGSISLTHVEDVCRAHVFIAEKESASGRYICCAVNTSVCELAKFLNKRYPMYNIPTNFGDFPSEAKLIISSEKLIKEGFSFKYGIEEIYDQGVACLKAMGLLQN
ncbi:Anthocyanidin reductase [Abeliophyllum distichum]|uniref:Anthocyanidin reductase n=1 Tax=Abeliophyllum distichum TaxID=126358 RepID=A0ABD1QI14_9LAMI